MNLSKGPQNHRTAPIPSRHRTRRRTVTLVATLATLFLVGFGAQSASAGFGTSPTGYYGPVDGHNYENLAEVYTTTGSAIAYTYAGPYGSSVPSGYVGIRGRLFTGGGTLSCQSSIVYSPQTLTSGEYWGANSCTKGASGSWYSYGVSYAYTGSGYDAYYTYQSPDQNS